MTNVVRKYLSDNYIHVQKAISNLNIRDKDDILNECCIYFSDLKAAEALIQRGEANKYLVGMIKMSAFSKSSPYQRKYNRYMYTELTYDIADEDSEPSDLPCLADLEVELKDIFHFDRVIFTEYIINKAVRRYSIRELSHDINLSQSTVAKKIRNIKNTLKNN